MISLTKHNELKGYKSLDAYPEVAHFVTTRHGCLLYTSVLAFAGQTFQFFRMRGEDGTLRQVGKGMAVVGKDIMCVGIHYNRSLAMFQLLQ